MISLTRLQTIVEEVARCEENDMEETTRDERFWMREAASLAQSLLDFYNG